MRIIGKFEQGSIEWFRVRLAMITASMVHRIMRARPDTLEKIRLELVAQLLGEIPASFTAAATEWGKTHEAQARSWIELRLIELGMITPLQETVIPGLIIHDDYLWAGGSADGLFPWLSLGEEIKCPYNQDVHAEHFVEHGKGWTNNIPEKYFTQVQTLLWITGYNHWLYASFDPRLITAPVDGIEPLFLTMVKRDEVYISHIVEKIQALWASTGIRAEQIRELRDAA